MSRRALVTGGARGIGAAIVQRLAGDGFEVVAPARAEMDLSRTDSVRAYLAKHVDLAIDVLVNNAGENKIDRIEDLALEDFERTLTVNLTSAFLLMQHVAPRMAARGWGRIVNMSSCYSLLARPGRAAYSASKAGLNGITRTAALEFGTRGVLVNAICPGFVETDLTRRNNGPDEIRALAAQTALGRLAQPAEIAEAVAWLASERNTYLTGQTLVVDGGFSIQ